MKNLKKKTKVRKRKIQKNPSKKVKIFGLLSVVWFLMIYSSTHAGYRSDDQGLIWLGIMPLVIGWGIYLIRKK